MFRITTLDEGLDMFVPTEIYEDTIDKWTPVVDYMCTENGVNVDNVVFDRFTLFCEYINLVQERKSLNLDITFIIVSVFEILVSNDNFKSMENTNYVLDFIVNSEIPDDLLEGMESIYLLNNHLDVKVGDIEKLRKEITTKLKSHYIKSMRNSKIDLILKT